jgi:arsenate reductase (thioredoxin)
MIKVLFICVHNSARSQIAETYLNHFGKGKFIAESAGLEAGILNPVVIDSMKEDGFDISKNKTKSVFDFYKQGKLYEYVITVCDEANAEKCPIFPGLTKKLHWGFEDPSSFTGTYDEKLIKTNQIRDSIKQKILDFVSIIN